VSSDDKEELQPVEDVWASAAQMAMVGIFIMLAGICLYFCRAILLPVVTALVIGTTFAPVVKAAARRGMAPLVTAVLIAIGLLVAAAIAVSLLAAPVSTWIARAPEIGSTIKQKLYVLDRPIAALHQLQNAFLPTADNAVPVEPTPLGIIPVITFVTPAAAQLVLMFVTLVFFLATQIDVRRYLASFFTTREAKLRFIRIANDVEEELASYVGIVSIINVCLGIATGLGAWLFGFPSPVLFGVIAMVFNYIPYIGPACTTLVLFAVGLVTFPSLGYALIPPAAFVALATVEGQFITPAVLGRHLTLNPLAVIVALGFWSWLWGPIGTFLAIPLTMIGLVTLRHLFPPDEEKLPG
jgi:predicted PurR-regulated permease PerM